MQKRYEKNNPIWYVQIDLGHACNVREKVMIVVRSRLQESVVIESERNIS